MTEEELPPLVVTEITEGGDKGLFNCHWSTDQFDFVILSRAQIDYLIGIAQAAISNGLDDDDDLPEWTDDQFRRAAVYHKGRLIRPADGTLTK
jgi:hypothetical protein